MAKSSAATTTTTTSAISTPAKEKASTFKAYLDSHPNNAKLRVSDTGISARIHNTKTNKIDIVTIYGITQPLKEAYWGKAPFVKLITSNKDIPGMSHVFYGVGAGGNDDQSARRSDDPMDDETLAKQLQAEERAFVASEAAAEPKRTGKAIQHDAFKRGKDIHAQISIYFEVYRNVPDPLQILPTFRTHLSIAKLGECSPATETILNRFNARGDQWYPVASELPVCNATVLSAMEKGLTTTKGSSVPRTVYGTSADAIVFSKAEQNYLILEFKTTTGNFAQSSGWMQGRFRDFPNSGLLRACIQLALTIEYFKRTYASVFRDNRISIDTLCGYVLWVNPDGSNPGEFKLTPAYQQEIISRFYGTPFF